MHAVDAALDAELQSALQSKPIPPFDVWLETDYKFSPKNSHYTEVTDCDPYRYQTNFAFLVGDLDTPEVNAIKGTQIGITHVLNAGVIYEPAVRGRNVIMYLPRNEDARYFSGTMLKHALACIPSVQSELLADPQSKDPNNTNSVKTLRRGQIHSRSMESASAFDQVQASTVFQDELSRATVKVKKSKEEEGEDPHDAAKSRMEGERNRKHVSISSPNEAHICRINRLYEKSQLKLEEQFQCPCCSRYIGLDFGDKKASHGMRWTPVYGSDGVRDNHATSLTAVYQCPACHDTFDHRQMCEQDQATGEFRNSEIRLDVKRRQYFYIDEHSMCTGKIAPKPHSVGVRLPGMLSRTKTFSDGVFEFLEAVDALKEGDNSKMVVFDKKYRAVAYVKKEDLGETLPYQILLARFEDYGAECPDPVQFITGWWDLQQGWIQGMYIGWGWKETAWILKSIVKMGDPATTNSMNIINDMRSYEFKKANGTSLRPRLTGIDSGDRPTLAYDFSIKHNKIAIIPTKGIDSYSAPLINYPENPKTNCKNTFMTNVGKKEAIDLAYGRLRLPDSVDDEPVPGSIHIPKPNGAGMGEKIYDAESYTDQHDEVDELGRPYSNGISEELCKQIVAYKEVIKNGRIQYEKTRPRNEGADCLVGNLAMLRIARLPKYGLRLRKYTESGSTPVALQVKADKNQKQPVKRDWGQLGQ